jgi:hypothetical protein
MVVHQNISEQMNRKNLLGLNQNFKENLPVLGILVDRLLLVTAAGNVINGTGIFYP